MSESNNETRNTSAFNVRIDFLKGTFSIPSSQVVEMYFIEDIFSPFVSGKLVFMDTLGILEYGPLTGNETIVIDYTGSGEKVHTATKIFSVFKISEVAAVGNSSNTQTAVELFFMDPFYMSMCIEQFSKSWPKDTKGHDIIKDIITKLADIDEKYLDLEKWEASEDGFQSFYIPWWTPLQAIKWIMTRMNSNQNSEKTSGYLFYANSKNVDDKDGLSTLNLRTLDSLLSETELMKIGEEDDSVYTFTESMVNYTMDKNRIFSYTISGIDKSAIKNLAGSHYYGFDTSKKDIIDLYKNQTYANMLTKHTILGKSSLFMDISVENAGRKFTGEETEKIITNIAYDNWVKRYCMQNYLEIVVDGHELRYAGGLIEVNFPPRHRPGENSGGSLANENLSGLYLIKSITNYFNPNDSLGYRQKITLIKNGYDSVVEGLLPAVNSNTKTSSTLGA